MAKRKNVVKRAKSYIEEEAAAKAMGVLKTGMSLYEDEGLRSMYESICYEYAPVTTAYSQLLLPSSDWHIPMSHG